MRWIQRFESFQKALAQLEQATVLSTKRELSDLEREGVIQRFEYTYELAWKTIKDFYEAQGESSIQGSRDAFRLAFQRGLIEHGEVWMQSIKSRQLTVHTYNEKTAKTIYLDIVEQYYFEFLSLKERLHLEQKKS